MVFVYGVYGRKGCLSQSRPSGRIAYSALPMQGTVSVSSPKGDRAVSVTSPSGRMMARASP